MTRYGRDPGGFRAHRIAVRGPWKRDNYREKRDNYLGLATSRRGFCVGSRRDLLADPGKLVEFQKTLRIQITLPIGPSWGKF